MSQSKLVLPAREGYDRWSPYYDQKGNLAVALKQREIGRLMANVRGLRVADLGCGTGVNSIAMAEGGAEVTGVDFSAGDGNSARALIRITNSPSSGNEGERATKVPVRPSRFDQFSLTSLSLTVSIARWTTTRGAEPSTMAYRRPRRAASR